MSVFRDILGRVIEPGDMIVLKNLEVFPAQILEISELAQIVPGKPPMRRIQMIAQINLNITDGIVQIPGFLIKKGEPAESLLTQ